ncbi:RDD family protein [Nocardioides sp.]|uniref:RDD family protein n=1 Tax=Nocardioides sp. TaxID=35761 RepID=UPI002ED47F87
MLETASWVRRTVALFVDWIASTLVVMLIIGPAGWSEDRAAGFYTMGVFILESALLMALVGGSFGQIATKIRVIRIDGTRRPPDLLRSLGRQVMICLVIPPLVFKPDGRGLHDMAMGTQTTLLEHLT